MQVIDKTGFVSDVWNGKQVTPWADFDDDACVEWDVAHNVTQLLPHFSTVKLIVMPFASSADGRGFSHAARLRELGFTGHIRARGHVLVDQFRAALRCGFDDVQITKDQALRNPESQWKSVVFGGDYQNRVFAA